MFGEILDRLHDLGWQEVVPTYRYWRFVKKGWMCRLDWYVGTVDFFRL